MHELQSRPDSEIWAQPRRPGAGVDEKVVGNLRSEQPGVGKGKRGRHSRAGGVIVHHTQPHLEGAEAPVVTKFLREILLRVDGDGSAEIPTILEGIAEGNDNLFP